MDRYFIWGYESRKFSFIASPSGSFKIDVISGKTYLLFGYRVRIKNRCRSHTVRLWKMTVRNQINRFDFIERHVLRELQIASL